MITVYSIGHSNHPLEPFLGLLKAAGVTQVADVRSVPYSRRWPQYRREPLARALQEAGIGYAWLGDSLGGRPAGDWVYAGGRLDVAQRCAAADFQAGLAALLELARAAPTAMLCAEEDPRHCHRQQLVTPALLARGAAVVHLRGDGHREAAPASQLPLL